MKKIMLTHQVSVQVDDEDYLDLMQWSWGANKGSANKHYYASRGVRQDGKVVRKYLHREVVGALPGDKVLFRDKDSLNCQKENLIHIKKELV